MPPPFDDFMARREAAARAYVTGNSGPVVDLSVSEGQATFFDPGGGFTQGASNVNEVNRSGSKSFGAKGKTRFEIKDKANSGGLAFWAGYQIADVEMNGKMVPMKLRITEVFREQEGDWKMIHRHASMAKEHS